MFDKPNNLSKAAYSGAGIALGLITGLAAALFLRSEKGQELTDEAKKAAKDVQRQLNRKMRNVKHLTQETYADLVEEIAKHYGDTKDLAEDELKKVKEYLLDQWEDIKAHMDASEEEEEDDDKNEKKTQHKK